MEREVLHKAIEMINRSERPVMFCGHGVICSNAGPLLREFAERTNIPVAFTLHGLSAMPADHPLSLGMMGMHGTVEANRAVMNADLIISFGRDIIVPDVGQHQMVAARSYNFQTNNSWFTSGGAGTMGCSLPMAIGAKLARPEERVWSISGDGGFQMNMQELGTIMEQGTDVKIILLNNGYLGMVRQWQTLFFDGRFSGGTHGIMIGHVAPEAQAGGLLAVVQEGDQIVINIDRGELTLMLDEAEIARRTAQWHPPRTRYARGVLARPNMPGWFHRPRKVL